MINCQLTPELLKRLRRGDIVQDRLGQSYIVLTSHGGVVSAIREVQVSNPSEWRLISAHNWDPSKEPLSKRLRAVADEVWSQGDKLHADHLHNLARELEE